MYMNTYRGKKPVALARTHACSPTDAGICHFCFRTIGYKFYTTCGKYLFIYLTFRGRGFTLQNGPLF